MIMFREFSYSWTYRYAGATRDRIFGEDSLVDVSDFFVVDSEFQDKALKPSKKTFLHILIEYFLVEDVDYAMSKLDPEQFASDELAPLLASYGVTFPKNPSDFELLGDDLEDGQEITWADHLFNIFDQEIVPRVADEVFTIMFPDREVLRKLNTNIASMVAQLNVSDFPDMLSHDGRVKRCTYWPMWLRHALVHRDKGCCALCLTDVTGVIASGGEYHIDHLIPLNIGGTNDPTNLQILCKSCNSSKGGIRSDTSRFQHVYW